MWVFNLNAVLIKTQNSTAEVRKTNFISSTIQIIKSLKPMKVQHHKGQRYVARILTS